MLKQDSGVLANEQELLKFLRQRPENLDAPDRPAIEDELPVDPAIAAVYEQEAELTFENNNPRVEGRERPQTVPLSQHNAVLEENEFLKEQLERVRERMSDYEDMLRSFKELQDELHAREQELQEKDKEIAGLTATIKSYEKRKVNMQFEIHKLGKVVQEHRQDRLRLEREVDVALDQLKSKERELVDADARHSHQLKIAAEEKQAISEQFDAIKDQTKKLVAKINQISLQKESKLNLQIDAYRKNYEEAKEKLAQVSHRTVELEEENRKLQVSIGLNRNEIERAVMNMKLENERAQADLRLSKERQMNDEVLRLRVQIERRQKEIQRLTSAATAKEVQIKGLQDEFEKFRLREQARTEKMLEDTQRRLVKKEQQLEGMRQQLQVRAQQLSQIMLENDQLTSKVQSLQRNLRQVYEQSTQLEGKLLTNAQEKAMLSSQNGHLKSELKSLKDIMQHYEGKVKGFGQEESAYLTEIKELKIKVEGLNETGRQNDKTIKELNSTVDSLNERDAKAAAEQRELKQMLMQTTISLQKSRHQCERQTRFIESYKLESERMKENTERKWRELKRLYEDQLESMEQRVRAAEAREKSVLVQLHQSDRQCKQYEFELTMSTDIIKDVEYRG